MKTKNESFLTGRMKSFKYAFKGFYHLITTEASIQAQLFFFIFITILGFYFDITRTEWMIQLLCCGLILSIEGLNTAIERLCDFIHEDFHKEIGLIKDISAGAVTFSVVFAVLVGMILYYPYIFN